MYSKLDAKCGCCSIHVTHYSSLLTTYNTYLGRCCFKCVPFGLVMSRGVSQMKMDQTTEQFPSVLSIHDDLCIYGKSEKEHASNLLNWMQVASNNGLELNSKKCHMKYTQVTFYGTIFSKEGMKPYAEKI